MISSVQAVLFPVYAQLLGFQVHIFIWDFPLLSIFFQGIIFPVIIIQGGRGAYQDQLRLIFLAQRPDLFQIVLHSPADLFFCRSFFHICSALVRICHLPELEAFIVFLRILFSGKNRFPDIMIGKHRKIVAARRSQGHGKP